MNRRTFFTSLFGLAIAPSVAIKVLSAPPTHKYSGLVGYKGREFMRAGYIYCPYNQSLMLVKPMDMSSRKIIRMDYEYKDNAKFYEKL